MINKIKKTNIKTLIPDSVNQTPDYYCTWQSQLYKTSNGGVKAQRANISEENIFGSGKGKNWINFYQKAKKDLLFVMDDSWDIPIEDKENFYGSFILNEEKFPDACCASDNKNALKNISDKVKAAGWKGLGVWVAAQEADELLENVTPEEYWAERIKWSAYADIKYWKVDWGIKGRDAQFRQMLTEFAHKHAPNLTVEHAAVKEIIGTSDAYRTYDVPAIMSIPMTFEKLADCLVYDAKPGYKGIVNCEDEAYIAAVLGCSMGIMRHGMVGAFENGKSDLSFPEIHRNIKTKLTEVVRAVRWHRIVPAFGVCSKSTYISEEFLTDTWEVSDQEAEIEAWWNYKNGDIIEKSGPAIISRNIPLPKVCASNGMTKPFVAASKSPDGVISVGTFGRTIGREYLLPKTIVEIEADESKMFGVFGYYDKLIIKTSYETADIKIVAQDLAYDEATEITNQVEKSDNCIVIEGALIEKIGKMAQEETDTSDPGMVIRVFDKDMED